MQWVSRCQIKSTPIVNCQSSKDCWVKSHLESKASVVSPISRLLESWHLWKPLVLKVHTAAILSIRILSLCISWLESFPLYKITPQEFKHSDHKVYIWLFWHLKLSPQEKRPLSRWSFPYNGNKSWIRIYKKNGWVKKGRPFIEVLTVNSTKRDFFTHPLKFYVLKEMKNIE